MNINPTNLVSDNNTAFNGKIIIKGKVENSVLRAINQSAKINGLTNGGYDVIIRTKSHKAGSRNEYHPYFTRMYKLTFSRIPENSKIDKILDFFNIIPRFSLTRRDHSQDGTIKALKDFHIDELVKKLENASGC